ncbi:MAG: DUF1761 domain-containing protein [Nanoarchaeota archaeon]|nr:DUF1761 domain-containing protein [Nanoarchaeota archaeon]
MAVPNVDVNLLAVLVSGVIAFIIGGLWYSPLLFGNAWMKGSNMNIKDMKKASQKGMSNKYIITFLGSLLTAYILAHFVKYLTAANFMEGMQAGMWIWLGFIVPVSLGSVLWEGKSMKFFFINIGYYFVSILLMGGILAVWQ